MLYSAEYIRELKYLVDPAQLLIQVGQISPNAIRDASDEIRCPCPLHGGDNPTSFVWKKSNGGTWYCFSRQCGGDTARHDVYGFLQLQLQLSFYDSVKYLENFLGIDESKRGNLENKLNSQAYTTAASDFKLKKYEVTKNEILQHLPYFYKEAFHVMVEYLLSRNYQYKDIELFNFYPAKDSFGLLRMGIPIYDDDNNLIGVSCRLMDTILEYPEKIIADGGKSYIVPKYRMSKFNKGSILYNLNNARKDSFKSGLIVVEGQFDVARLHVYGIQNAVGYMGSILTNKQVALLHKYCYDITFLVEEGEAAYSGVISSIKRINPYTMKISVAKLPSGDADSNRKDIILDTLKGAKRFSIDEVKGIQDGQLEI